MHSWQYLRFVVCEKKSVFSFCFDKIFQDNEEDLGFSLPVPFCRTPQASPVPTRPIKRGGAGLRALEILQIQTLQRNINKQVGKTTSMDNLSKYAPSISQTSNGSRSSMKISRKNNVKPEPKIKSPEALAPIPTEQGGLRDCGWTMK